MCFHQLRLIIFVIVDLSTSYASMTRCCDLSSGFSGCCRCDPAPTALLIRIVRICHRCMRSDPCVGPPSIVVDIRAVCPGRCMAWRYASCSSCEGCDSNARRLSHLIYSQASLST